MTVQRYHSWDSEDDEDGHYVAHDDYAALLKERDALAAENGTIKTMNDCLAEELRGYESDGAFDGPDMHKLWHSHASALPATDAAIANIQAQGVDMAITVIKTMMSATAPAHHAIGMLKAQAAQLRKELAHD